MIKNLLLFAGAAALGIATPAVAQPGKAKGPKHKGAKVERQMPAYAYGNNPYAQAQMGNRYGGMNCPPGLAKKTPACVPPGQAKKMANAGAYGVSPYMVGQVIPQSVYRPVQYNQIPTRVLPQGYNYDPYSRYGYANGTYYRVDPATMVIQQVLGSILR